MPYNREDNYKFDILDMDDDTSVAASGTKQYLIQPPIGFIYEIADIDLSAQDPAGSAAGTHEFEIGQTGKSASIALIKGTTGTQINLNNKYGFVGDSSELPSNISQQYDLMHKVLICNNAHPITIDYNNDTDVAAATSRKMRISIKIYREAF